MRTEYSRSKELNFGDDLNVWLWPKLIGECLDETDNIAFLGIGTILTQDIYNARLSGAKKIVLFSSGAGEKSVPVIDEQWKVYCVRGPRTAKRLGISSDYAIADGAYLLRTIDLPKPAKKYKTAFIPHHRSEDYIDWKKICQKAGIDFISAKQPVDDFLSKLFGCEKVLTEAMHGAITADAFRIPWVPVRFATNFYEEKWNDFFESMKISPTIETLPVMYQKRQRPWRLVRNSIKRSIAKIFPAPEKWSRLPVSNRLSTDSDLENLALELKRIAQNSHGLISDDAVVENVTSRLMDKLEQVKKDYFSGVLLS